MIHQNKHPSGRFSNFLFGLCQLLDGVVRVISAGYAHTNLMCLVTRYQSRKMLENIKKKREVYH